MLTFKSEHLNSDLSPLNADLRAFIVEYRKGHDGATDLIRKHITAGIERNQEAIKLHVTQAASEAERSLKRYIGVVIRGVKRHEARGTSKTLKYKLRETDSPKPKV